MHSTHSSVTLSRAYTYFLSFPCALSVEAWALWAIMSRSVTLPDSHMLMYVSYTLRSQERGRGVSGVTECLAVLHVAAALAPHAPPARRTA